MIFFVLTNKLIMNLKFSLNITNIAISYHLSYSNTNTNFDLPVVIILKIHFHLMLQWNKKMGGLLRLCIYSGNNQFYKNVFAI